MRILRSWRGVLPVRDGLPVAQRILGLVNEPPRFRKAKRYPDDFVLVAVDAENTNYVVRADPRKNEGVNSQVGLAMLDSRDLVVPRPLDGKKPADIISTFNIVTGSEEYIMRARKQYLFKNHIAVEHKDLAETITKCIPQDRYVFLVGHGVMTDIGLLRKIGVFLWRGNFTVLDTGNIFWRHLKLENCSPPKLKDALDWLRVPYSNLHCAGNDAFFTLRALLIVCILACDDPKFARKKAPLLRHLAEIATTHIPNDELKGLLALHSSSPPTPARNHLITAIRAALVDLQDEQTLQDLLVAKFGAKG